MVLVDSSVWIEAVRPQGDLATKVALEALLEVDGALVSGPILLEVLGGCRPADRKRLLDYLLMAVSWVECVPGHTFRVFVTLDRS